MLQIFFTLSETQISTKAMKMAMEMAIQMPGDRIFDNAV